MTRRKILIVIVVLLIPFASAVILQRTITIPYYRYISVGRLYGTLRILLKHTSPDGYALFRLQRALESWPDDDGVVADLQRERAFRLGMFWPYPPASWALRPQQGYRAGAADALAFVVFRPLLTYAFRRGLPPYADAIAVAREPWPSKQDSARVLAQRYNLDARRQGRAPSSTVPSGPSARRSRFGSWTRRFRSAA